MKNKKKLSNEEKAKLYAKEMLTNLKANVSSEIGETPKNKQKANEITDALLKETLKQIKTR